VPNFNPASLPFAADVAEPAYRLDLAGESIQMGAVSIGNPHAVLTVASVATAEVARLGPAIEHHRRFPQRVNVGFMEIIDRTHIRLRVHERGVGETLACGTGACAAVAVGQRHGSLDAAVEVHVRGGELRVNCAGPGESVWLTGPAEVSFVGYFEV
jgi:diaminopimelate epimerase